MKTTGRGDLGPSASPKFIEFSLTYLESVLGRGFCVKTSAFSDENASYGNVSVAYGGGPTGTPNLL